MTETELDSDTHRDLGRVLYSYVLCSSISAIVLGMAMVPPVGKKAP